MGISNFRESENQDLLLSGSYKASTGGASAMEWGGIVLSRSYALLFS